MSNKVANAGAVLLASIGMAFAALGVVGINPTPSTYTHPSIECTQ